MRRIVGAAGLITAAVLLTACSGSGGGNGSAAGGGAARLGPAAAGPATAVPSPGGLEANDSATGSGTSVDTKLMLDPASVIKTASIQVEIAKAADVPAQADAAGNIALAAGGSVFADDRTSGEHGSARLTLKVPPDSMTSVLTRLAALGHELTRQSASQDVTSQVADVNSRVASARGSVAELRALYSRATKIGDVITIEGEIAQREADLESLEAQQRALAAQTSMATVEVYLSTSAVVPATTHHDRRGFLGGLSRGWNSFASASGALATGVGAALPFLVLALLIGAAAWRLRSAAGRLRPRRPNPPPAPVAE